MFEVRYPLRDETTGRTGFLRLGGGIWTGDVCGFEFADTVYGLAGTATCDWREPRPRVWIDEGSAEGDGAETLLDRVCTLLLPFHRGAFRHLTQRDVRRCDGRDRSAPHLTFAEPITTAEIDWLLDRLPSVCTPRRVLDVGCSAGEVVRRLRARGVDAWGFDVCPDVATHAVADAAPYLRSGPLSAIPYGPDDGFDTLLALDVFEHVPEHLLGPMIGELARLGASRLVARIALCEFHLPGHVTLRPLSWWDRQLAPWFHRTAPAGAADLAAACDAEPSRYLRVYELASVPASR